MRSQIYEDATGLGTITERHGERILLVGRCSQSHSDENYGVYVVAMHVPPIKGTAQVKFNVLGGTEPTLSMPMLVANGNRVVHRGEDAMLITAKGETAPLTETIGS